jgi:ribonuclease D
LTDLGFLAFIFADSKVEKVFHAAAYDISCLSRDYAFTFTNLFDTHLAAHLLGYEQLGLSALMEKLLGVVHSKHRQRDDWSRRPLDRLQLEYAATDTHYLLKLRDLLEEQLKHKGRLVWAREEFDAAASVQTDERSFDPEGFRRIKGSRGLALRELLILRALYLLRDRYAREMDLPPFKVLTNSVLLEIARKPSASPQALAKRPGISYRIGRKFADEIFQTVESARAQDPSSLIRPAQNQWRAPSPESRRRLERLKEWRQAKARELELSIGVVFPGNLLEVLAAAPAASQTELDEFPGMRKWRAREFGAEILEILKSA